MISLRAYIKSQKQSQSTGTGTGTGKTDWRNAGWNRRLLAYLAPSDTADAPMSSGTAGSELPGQNDLVSAAVAEGTSEANKTTSAASPTTIPPLEPAWGGPLPKTVANRRAAKARFGAIHTRLDQIEEGLESLSERFEREQARGERRTQRAERLLDHAADATERHTTLLHSILIVLERVERRLGPANAAGTPRAEAAAPRASYFRPSTFAERRSDHEAALDGADNGAPSRVEPTYRGDGPSVSGTLSEISLPTLLSMFELERRTGRLGLSQHGKARISFDFLDGVVVGSKIDGDDADAVPTLQNALDWRDGHFTFCQGTVLAGTTRTRTVGTLLLEATRRNDEAVR